MNEDSGDEGVKKEIEKWQTLVHVCRRWRSVVFGSPRRLNLRLVCTTGTPARDTLDVWPSLPLLIQDSGNRTESVDDFIAVLERSDCVVEIHLSILDGSDLENVLAEMQVPFPELTDLQLSSEDGMESVVPDSFLGGFAPRLQFLWLDRIPFPGLPNLLLSAAHLVTLHLENIPHFGYISPEAMVTALSTLTSLERLSLEFEYPPPHTDRESRRPPPLTRCVLPVLTYFCFEGFDEYLDDIVACIDIPQLRTLKISFFDQTAFDLPQFIQFMSRTPTLKAFEKAQVRFTHDTSSVNLSSQTPGYGTLDVQIQCMELDWQVSSMEQVCTSCLPPLSTLEDLYIYEYLYSELVWQDDIEDALWLDLLHPFAAVKNLYLSEKFASHIMPALQELDVGGTTEVLPTLQNIFLEEHQLSGTVRACIQQFIATRQATSHPVAVSCWDRDQSKFMY